MKRLSISEVKKILEKHELWLKTDGEKGKCADFTDTDLKGVDFRGLDLRKAQFDHSDMMDVNFQNADLCDSFFPETCLKNANFQNAKLRNVCFCYADLISVDFQNADLCGADLFGTYLKNASFRNAKLCNAILFTADLINTDFRNADLTNADLNDSDTDGMIYDKTTIPAIACPEKGSFIGFMKACGVFSEETFIVKLRIPEDAKRSSATGSLCRCSKAEVLSITNLDGTETDVTAVKSLWSPTCVCRQGKIIEIRDFDECRWHDEAPGIHFFMDRKDAVKWQTV